MALGAADPGDVFATLGVSKFVGALDGRESVVVLDLGPAVGANVMFLGGRLGCKLHVQDVLSDPETWWTDEEKQQHFGSPDGNDSIEVARKSLGERQLNNLTNSVDGVLCWDVFDYLSDESAESFASEVVRVLKPGGVTLLCHGAEIRTPSKPMRYEIVDEMRLRYRPLATERPTRRVWHSRAFVDLFDGLAVSNSFLLTTRMREVVLRKPLPRPA